MLSVILLFMSFIGPTPSWGAPSIKRGELVCDAGQLSATQLEKCKSFKACYGKFPNAASGELAQCARRESVVEIRHGLLFCEAAFQDKWLGRKFRKSCYQRVFLEKPIPKIVKKCFESYLDQLKPLGDWNTDDPNQEKMLRRLPSHLTHSWIRRYHLTYEGPNFVTPNIAGCILKSETVAEVKTRYSCFAKKNTIEARIMSRSKKSWTYHNPKDIDGTAFKHCQRPIYTGTAGRPAEPRQHYR